MMNHILWEEISEGWCKVYMDDILIMAEDLETLRKRTKQILQIMKTHDLYLKPEKCDFEKQQVDYLGFIIKPGEITMDPNKLSGIADWPSPKTVKQVRSFLGFCNFYRRFIYRFSHMAKPLTELTKKGKPFEWTQECENAFQLMKAQFLKAPVLRMPDPTQPLYLETDASLNASGAVLMQKDGNGHLHPCGYLSKTFSPAERNYPIYDRELLALVRALQEWRIYLEGAPHRITVYTDHKNLQYFRTAQKLHPRLSRYSLLLSQFDLHLIHKPGKPMTLSDPLSRRADVEDVKKEEAVIVLPDSLFVNLLDIELMRILRKTTDEQYDPKALEQLQLPDGQANKEDSDWEVQEIDGQSRVFYQGRTYVPDAPTLRRRILQEYHDHPTAGHPGAATTLINLKRDYWWPGMPNFVGEYVKGCLLCQTNKINRNPWKGPLFPIKGPIDPLPFKQISMDQHFQAIWNTRHSYLRSRPQICIHGIPRMAKDFRDQIKYDNSLSPSIGRSHRTSNARNPGLSIDLLHL
jgi:hypothetical protein